MNPWRFILDLENLEGFFCPEVGGAGRGAKVTFNCRSVPQSWAPPLRIPQDLNHLLYQQTLSVLRDEDWIRDGEMKTVIRATPGAEGEAGEGHSVGPPSGHTRGRL